MASASAGAAAAVMTVTTGAGTRVDVTLKLSQLQNFCKRDPVGYRAEYDAQIRRLESELRILFLTGGGGGIGASKSSSSTAGTASSSSARQKSKSSSGGTPLQELMQFAAAVASSSYKGDESDRVAQLFVRLLVGGAGGKNDGTEEEEGQGDDDNHVDGSRDERDDEEGDGRQGPSSSLLKKGSRRGKRSTTKHAGTAARPSNSKSAILMDVREVTFLSDSALHLDRNVRHTAVSCLILMRNKGTIDPLYLLPIFFKIMAVVPDKALRELLYRHTVQDVSNLNKATRNEPLNRAMLGFFHRVVEAHNHHPTGHHNSNDDNDVECATVAAARLATNVVAELYRRRVWTDARAVAVLASAVLSSTPSVATRALRFFLNIEERMARDDATKAADQIEAGSKIDYHNHSKKTAARQRHVQRQKKNRAKMLRRQQEEAEGREGGSDDGHVRLAHDKGVEASKKLYPAVELLRDPQGLAEAVLKRLRAPGSYKYEVKLLMMNFCTRLVGNHHLLLLPLYPFLTKYLTSHQRHVTQVLCYAVQACHEHVPPDEVHLLLKTIAHNFITERCTEEQMAVGINAARAICARVPSVLALDGNGDGNIDDEDRDAETGAATSGVALDVPAFVKDLAGYSNHRDRSVSIAGKAWLNFVRETHPGLLTGKARGLAGTAGKKAGVRPLRYGEQRIAAGVEGADLLAEYEAKKAARRAERGTAASSSGKNNGAGDDDNGVEHTDDEDGWEDVPDGDEDGDDEWEEVTEEDVSSRGDGSDREEGDAEDSTDGQDDEIGTDDDDSSAPNLVLHDESEPPRPAENGAGTIPDVAKMSAEERDLLKQQVSSTRIFSSTDFDKMRKLVERERRLRTDPREAARRKRAIARGQDVDLLSEDGNSSDESDDDDDNAGYTKNIRGVVDPLELMADAKKKRQSRAEKLEKIVAGRTKFAAKGREGGSTNVEKKRAKNFLMSKFSRSARSKSAGKGILGKRKAPKKQMNHDAKKRRRKL